MSKRRRGDEARFRVPRRLCEKDEGTDRNGIGTTHTRPGRQPGRPPLSCKENVFGFAAGSLFNRPRRSGSKNGARGGRTVPPTPVVVFPPPVTGKLPPSRFPPPFFSAERRFSHTPSGCTACSSSPRVFP